MKCEISLGAVLFEARVPDLLATFVDHVGAQVDLSKLGTVRDEQ